MPEACETHNVTALHKKYNTGLVGLLVVARLN